MRSVLYLRWRSEAERQFRTQYLDLHLHRHTLEDTRHGDSKSRGRTWWHGSVHFFGSHVCENAFPTVFDGILFDHVRTITG